MPPPRAEKGFSLWPRYLSRADLGRLRTAPRPIWSRSEGSDGLGHPTPQVSRKRASGQLTRKLRFGQGQLPFDLGALGDERDREKLDFWLERWVEYYSYMQGLRGVEFIRYEEFLERPSQVVEHVARVTGTTIDAFDIPKFKKEREEIPKSLTFCSIRSRKASLLYESFQKR